MYIIGYHGWYLLLRVDVSKVSGIQASAGGGGLVVCWGVLWSLVTVIAGGVLTAVSWFSECL